MPERDTMHIHKLCVLICAPYSKYPFFPGYFWKNLVFHGEYIFFSRGSTSYPEKRLGLGCFRGCVLFAPGKSPFLGGAAGRNPPCYEYPNTRAAVPNLPPAPNARPCFSWYHVGPLLKKEVFTMENLFRFSQKVATEKSLGIWRLRG